LAARTAADGKWVGRIARAAADGVGARNWLETGGEKKPLGISELGCADGSAPQMVEGCGGRGWPLEISGRLRTAWVQGIGWKWLGKRSLWG